MKINFCRIMAGISLRYRNNIAIVNIERGRRYTFPEYIASPTRSPTWCVTRWGWAKATTSS